MARNESAPRGIRVILSLALLLSLGINFQGATAATPKVGQSCTKSGLKSGVLICSKVGTKLIWQLPKSAQVISFQAPENIPESNKSTTVVFSSSSKLKVNATSTSQDICLISGNLITFVRAGLCAIQLSQDGNSKFFAAPTTKFQFWIIGSNEISFTLPNFISLNVGTLILSATSSSNLPVSFESNTPAICTLSDSVLVLKTVGRCTIRASQPGSEAFSAATPVEASINVRGPNAITLNVPSSLLLSQKTYTLSSSATSSLPVILSVTTPEVCGVSGNTLTLIKTGMCIVRATQDASDFYESAQPVEVSTQLSDVRATADQVDAISNFQVKAIYVVPSDGTDHNYDTNGFISSILDEGNSYLNSQIGLSLPVDINSKGYDIQFLKTGLTTAYLSSAGDLVDKLLAESKVLEIPGENRKNYVFFIDVPSLRNGAACGYARYRDIGAVVAIGPPMDPSTVTCSTKALNFANYASGSWTHELFHNFGVRHTPDDPCDFMRGQPETIGTCPQGTGLTIDKNRNRYIGGDSQGVNLLQLRIWKNNTNRMDLIADCFLNPTPRSDGFNYAYCPTGTQTIGSLKYCYSAFRSISLQEFINGSWVDIGSGNSYVNPWGSRVDWSCNAGYSAAWKSLTISKPGISLYKWMINGNESEQFKVIWVQ